MYLATVKGLTLRRDIHSGRGEGETPKCLILLEKNVCSFWVLFFYYRECQSFDGVNCLARHSSGGVIGLTASYY